MPTVAVVDLREVPPRSASGERGMALLDLLERPRALHALAELGRRAPRPFDARAFQHASGYNTLRSSTNLAQDMEEWGFVLITSDPHGPHYVVELTDLGRRLALLALQMQRQLLEAGIRYHGKRLLAPHDAEGPA